MGALGRFNRELEEETQGYIEDPGVLVHGPNVEVVEGPRDKSRGFLTFVIPDVVD